MFHPLMPKLKSFINTFKYYPIKTASVYIKQADRTSKELWLKMPYQVAARKEIIHPPYLGLMEVSIPLFLPKNNPFTTWYGIKGT